MNDMVDLLKSIFKGTDARTLGENRLSVTTPGESVLAVLDYLKASGFYQLKSISCVDWIDDNEFELVYHVASLERPLHIMVKTRIDRDKPVFPTAMSIFKNAGIFEREMHELFGVMFEGNPDLNPLFLDNWKDIPPFRKDFDMRKYVKDTYDSIPSFEEYKWQKEN